MNSKITITRNEYNRLLDIEKRWFKNLDMKISERTPMLDEMLSYKCEPETRAVIEVNTDTGNKGTGFSLLTFIKNLFK